MTSSASPAARLLVRLVLPLAAVALLLAVATSGGGAQHRLFVDIPAATNMIPGQEIRAAGRPVGNVGSIAPINHGRAARVELTLDDSVWPVPVGSTFALRWGGTVSFSNRYVLLTRAGSGRSYPDSATI